MIELYLYYNDLHFRPYCTIHMNLLNYTKYLSRCTLSRFWLDIKHKFEPLVIDQYHYMYNTIPFMLNGIIVWTISDCTMNKFLFFCMMSNQNLDRVHLDKYLI
jgi:hypothetical protein